MRLSDILKKSQTPSEETKKAPPSQPLPEDSSTGTPNTESGGGKITITAFTKPASPTIETIPAQSPLLAEDVYGDAIVEIKNVLNKTPFQYPQTIASIPRLLDLIIAENEAILLLVNKSTPDAFMYGFSVNITILSLFIGHNLNLDQKLLMNLGYCSFVYYAARLKRLGISVKGSKVLSQDIEKLSTAIPMNAELLTKVPALLEDIKSSLTNILSTLKKENLPLQSPYTLAQLTDADVMTIVNIIAIPYVFETLTHAIEIQDRVIPHEALKTIINNADMGFDSRLIKLFVEKLSIYPPGSFVRLNTNDIAKVTGINPGLPTRPKVYVLIDSFLRKSASPKSIDLSTMPMLYIKEAIDETKLEVKDKRLSLELKAMRWWVKGI